jgi:hypothetical protein
MRTSVTKFEGVVELSKPEKSGLEAIPEAQRRGIVRLSEDGIEM